MKHELEFLEEEHIYLVDGIITPSVTQILKKKFGNMYDFVPKAVLNKAADKGTELHKAIELLETENKPSDLVEVRNYKFLKKHYKWKTLGNEIPIILEDKGKVVAAGTTDLYVEIDGKKGLGDIKRTSTLNKEYLFYQLNLYRIGFEQTYGEKIDFLFGLHLRENKRKFVDIRINEEMAKEIIYL